MPDFRSDTVTRPTPAMRQAMATAEVGDDVYGDDPTVNRLEAEAAALLGTEAAVFVPSGTMANQIALRLHARPGDEVIAEQGSHVFRYEGGGAAALSGIQIRPLRGPGGRLDPDAVAAAVNPDDPHCARTAGLCVENTHTEDGGAVVPLVHLQALRTVAARHGLRVHLDGARLWNAAAATGVPVAEFAACADTVACCLSKGLGAPVGSVLAGTAEAIRQARRHRKTLGGGMRQAGVLAAAGLVALRTMRDRLVDDHARARRLAEGLADLPGLRVDLGSVQTNIVHAGTAPGAAAAWVRGLGERGVKIIDMGPSTIRFVTHCDVGDGDVDAALRAVRDFRL